MVFWNLWTYPEVEFINVSSLKTLYENIYILVVPVLSHELTEMKKKQLLTLIQMAIKKYVAAQLGVYMTPR